MPRKVRLTGIHLRRYTTDKYGRRIRGEKCGPGDIVEMTDAQLENYKGSYEELPESTLKAVEESGEFSKDPKAPEDEEDEEENRPAPKTASKPSTTTVKK